MSRNEEKEPGTRSEQEWVVFARSWLWFGGSQLPGCQSPTCHTRPHSGPTVTTVTTSSFIPSFLSVSQASLYASAQSILIFLNVPSQFTTIFCPLSFLPLSKFRPNNISATCSSPPSLTSLLPGLLGQLLSEISEDVKRICLRSDRRVRTISEKGNRGFEELVRKKGELKLQRLCEFRSDWFGSVRLLE